MVVYHDPQLLAEDRSGIDRLVTLGELMKSIDGVKEVLSLAELDPLVKLFAGPEGIVHQTHKIANAARDVFRDIPMEQTERRSESFAF